LREVAVGADSPDGGATGAAESEWDPHVPVVVWIAMGVLAVAVVVFVVLYGAAYFWSHPSEVDGVALVLASEVTFETKDPMAVALLQGLGGVIGVLVVLLLTPLILWWLFRRRLGWPGPVMVPIWLVTVAGAGMLAGAVGAGVIGVAVEEKILIDKRRNVVEVTARSLTDFLTSRAGDGETIPFADIAHVEYVHNWQDGAEFGHDEAEVRVRRLSGRSSWIPTGAQPDSAYRVAVAIARASGVRVQCFEKDDRASSRTPMGCP